MHRAVYEQCSTWTTTDTSPGSSDRIVEAHLSGGRDQQPTAVHECLCACICVQLYMLRDTEARPSCQAWLHRDHGRTVIGNANEKWHIILRHCSSELQSPTLSCRFSKGSASLRTSHQRTMPSVDTLMHSLPVLLCSQAMSYTGSLQPPARILAPVGHQGQPSSSETSKCWRRS